MSRASYVRLAALSLIWGSVFLWIKESGESFSPVQMVLIRLALGAAVILAVGYARGLRLPSGAELWGHITVAALLGNAIPWVLYAEGEKAGSTSLAGVVNGTAPIWTLAATLVLGQEKRLSNTKLAAVALGLAGTVIVVAPWSAGGSTDVSSVLCFVVGSASFGTSFAYIGRFLAGRGLPPIMMAGAQLVSATAILLVVTPFLGRQAIHVHPWPVFSILVLGVVCTGLAALLNFELISRDGPAATSTVTYLMTVVAVVLGAVFLDEALTWDLLLGEVVILLAVALMRRKPAAAPAATTTLPTAEPVDSRSSANG